MEIQFERTEIDENFEEIWAILAAKGVTSEMAMAKLMELKAQDDEKMRLTASFGQALPPGRTGGW